ncbi:MAG: Xaa-Pro aminopeptidase [Desulfotalea sp.]
MFGKEIYEQRRLALKARMQTGIAIFIGNIESPRNFSDNCYPFRQDSTFLYYFGINQPNMIAVINFDSGDEIIFANAPTIDEIVWMGPQPSMSELAEQVGVVCVGQLVDFFKYVVVNQKKKTKLHVLPPYTDSAKISLGVIFDCQIPNIHRFVSIDLVKAVIAQREIKLPEEIEQLHLAASISVDMHLAAMKSVRPGMRESDMMAEVMKVALAHGAPSFQPIVTTNGATLHNHFYGNILKDGDLLLLDAGAESPEFYAGDLSSVIPVNGIFSAKQRNIYEITLASHEKAISCLKPGVNFIDIHFAACKEIAKGLSELGLMKGNVDTAVERGAHALFMPSGLGHMLGLDVHDMENLDEVHVGYDGKAKSNLFGLKSLRLGKELKAGMVLTIEPGIYFIPELIKMWSEENRFDEFLNYPEIEKYLDFTGIRNEEDFLITETGYEVLGKAKPKTIDDVEAVILER